MKEMNIKLGKHTPCAKPCANAAEMASLPRRVQLPNKVDLLFYDFLSSYQYSVFGSIKLVYE